MKLPGMETTLARLSQKIKPGHRFAFFSALGVGFATHLYFFTNLLLNHETSAFIYRLVDMTNQGRWFLRFACLPGGYVMAPWLRGGLALLYLSLAAVVLTELLGLRRKLSIFLVSAVLVTYPAIGATLTYLYDADAYMLALLLATLSVWAARRWKYGFLPGAALLALSLGTYQAYVAFAILLILLLLLIEVLKGEKTPRQQAFYALRYAAMGIIAFALYFIILRVALAATGQAMSSYQNMNALAQGPLEMLLSMLTGIPAAYGTFFTHIFDIPGFGTPLRIGILWLFAAVVLAVLVYAVTSSGAWRRPLRLLAAGVLLALVPLGACFVALLQPESFHLLMRQPFSLFIMLPVVLLDRFYRPATAATALQWVAGLFTLLLCFQFVVTTNTAYTNMQLRMEKAFSVTVRLADRIQQAEGYRPDLPVLVVGHYDYDTYPLASTIDPAIGGLLGTETNFILNSQNYTMDYLRDFHHLANPELTGPRREAWLKDPRVLAMENFPAPGSVRVIDGVVVVKLSEEAP